MSLDILTYAARTVKTLQAEGKTLSAAESCTGGWFSKSIVDIPGASAVFLGSVVSYASEIKASVLGVSPDDLLHYTAVSSQVCHQMAEGVRRLMQTDFAISVTGLAGPGGGSEEIPVGRVYIGIADKNGTTVYPFDFSGMRDEVRCAAVTEMHRLLTSHIENNPQGDTQQ